MIIRSDRRAFLKQTAMAAATAAITTGIGSSAFYPLPILGDDRVDEQGVKWDKAPCRFCGTGCHVQVGVKEGRVVAIAGDL
jgi:nitrate reductase NapA